MIEVAGLIYVCCGVGYFIMLFRVFIQILVTIKFNYFIRDLIALIIQ